MSEVAVCFDDYSKYWRMSFLSRKTALGGFATTRAIRFSSRRKKEYLLVILPLVVHNVNEDAVLPLHD
jgi:hypothetical protein